MGIFNVLSVHSKLYLHLTLLRHFVVLIASAFLVAACTKKPDEDIVETAPSDTLPISQDVGQSGQSEEPREGSAQKIDGGTTFEALPKVSPEALALEIEIISFEQDAKFDQRSRELADGTFQFRPADDAVPTGALSINYKVDGIEQNIETNLTAIVKVGGKFPYYLFETESGQRFQSVRNTILPYMRDMREYEGLNLDQVKERYLRGTPEERESAIWDVWKLESGKQVAPIVENLTAGNQEDIESSARIISGFEIHHPLVTQAVQKQLEISLHYQGPVDGFLSDDTISAIMHFQEDNGLKATGYLSAETLVAMFEPAPK